MTRFHRFGIDFLTILVALWNLGMLLATGGGSLVHTEVDQACSRAPVKMAINGSNQVFIWILRLQ